MSARRAVLPVLVLAATVLTVAPAAEATPHSDPPSATMRAEGYALTRTVRAPGLDVYAGSLTRPSIHPSWTVTIFAPTVDDLTGQATTAELGDARWASATVRKLTAAGYHPTSKALAWPGYSDTPRGLQGFRVRAGSFPDEAGADDAAATLTEAGFPTATTQWSGYDGDQPIDAEQVHIAVVDPARWKGTISATHGATIAQHTTTSELARQAHATVAVNGGYFATSDADGFQGVPSGLAAYEGQLQAAAVGDRAALVLRQGRPSIERLVSTATLTAGKDAEPLDGINRRPGLVRDCGLPDLEPTILPRQDVTCTAGDDAVLFTAQFGAALPTGPGAQAVFDASGRVVAVGDRGGSIPIGGSAVQAIGDPSAWLQTHLTVGEITRVETSLRDGRTGKAQPLEPATAIVSAGPTLVRDGRPAVDAVTEGFLDPDDLSFGFAFSQIRQPRTMAGTDASGRLVLVTVDGREPGISEGLTLTELATLARRLGLQEAMNLDGGGSTTMAINGQLVTHPSDTTGERAVGDAVIITP